MQFTLLEKLWESDFGVNYLARDSKLKKNVVVRKMSSELDHNNDARWKREWHILKRLRHQSIPVMGEMTTYNFEGRRFPMLSHEYHEGEQLSSLLKREPIPEARILNICGELLRLLIHLQSQSPAIIHRDISPRSIYLVHRQDHVQLWDFGAATFFSGHQETVTKEIGDLVFAAPEQLLGSPDLSSDLYSVGMVLARCLSPKGERPRINWQTGLIDIPILQTSAEIKQWITKATAPPSERFATAEEAYASFACFLPNTLNHEPVPQGELDAKLYEGIQGVIARQPDLLQAWYDTMKANGVRANQVSIAGVVLGYQEMRSFLRSEIITWIMGLHGIRHPWLNLQAQRFRVQRMTAELKSLSKCTEEIPFWARITGLKVNEIRARQTKVSERKDQGEVKILELESDLYHRLLPYAKVFSIPVHELLSGD